MSAHQNKKGRAKATWKVLAALLCLAAAILPPHAGLAATGTSSQLRSDFGLGAQWRMNSIARMLAGLAPLSPAHFDLAATDAWKAHATACRPPGRS
ncbi:MAG: hypothetical protein FJY55_07665 [Betaproteobacteria bacterium]|nr:hypothetical protein [Betaproteobacteria bacterium]